MLLKFLTKCVPLCTPNWTPERWFKRYHMNARKMKNPANQKISRVLLPLEKWFVGVADLKICNTFLCKPYSYSIFSQIGHVKGQVTRRFERFVYKILKAQSN